MNHRITSLLTSLILAIVGITLVIDSADAQRRFQIGGPLGIGIGGGQGLTIGGGYGVQLGGGQGLRFGPPNAGVQYGGGQGARFGTPNRGLQYGGGQLLRVGGPVNGIRIGGGQGISVGPQPVVPFNADNGLQAGQFQTSNQPFGGQSASPSVFQPTQPLYGQRTYSSPAYQQPQTYPNQDPSNMNQSSATLQQFSPTDTGYSSGTNTTVPVVPQNQFDEARQSTVTPEVPSSIAPANPVLVSPVPATPVLTNPVQSNTIVPVVPQTQFDAARQATEVIRAPSIIEPAKPDVSDTGTSVLQLD